MQPRGGQLLRTPGEILCVRRWGFDCSWILALRASFKFFMLNPIKQRRNYFVRRLHYAARGTPELRVRFPPPASCR